MVRFLDPEIVEKVDKSYIPSTAIYYNQLLTVEVVVDGRWFQSSAQGNAFLLSQALTKFLQNFPSNIHLQILIEPQAFLILMVFEPKPFFSFFTLDTSVKS